MKPPWSLGESCQGNGEWNKSTVACQEGGLGRGLKEQDQEFTEQIFRFVVKCSLRWMGTRGWGGKQEASLHYGIFTSSLPLKGEYSYFLSGWWETFFLNDTKNAQRRKGHLTCNKVATINYFLRLVSIFFAMSWCIYLVCGWQSLISPPAIIKHPSSLVINRALQEQQNKSALCIIHPTDNVFQSTYQAADFPHSYIIRHWSKYGLIS